MTQNHDLTIMLEQVNAPAFLVRENLIYAVNSAAAQYHITVGQSIYELIVIGREEYSAFDSGDLYLTVSVNNVKFDCAVSKLENTHLFILGERPASSDLQLLSLVGKQLSFPLSELSILFDKLSGMTSEEKERINRILFQLHRITGNMSDTIHLQNGLPNLETIEIGSVIGEILEKAKSLFDDTPVDISYKLPHTAIYAPASAELLERAVYNLLSNAAKFGSGKITASLTQEKGKAFFSIANSCPSNGLRYGIFTRYRRTPGLENPRYGLGLGMTMVHAIAKAHGGTVLVETPTEHEIRITMSISLKSLKNSIVRSPIIKPDIYGGRDTALVELSDVLPAHLYKKM